MPRLLFSVGQNKEQETNGRLLLKVMDQKVYRKMHAVKFFLVNDARMMEGLRDFIVEGA